MPEQQADAIDKRGFAEKYKSLAVRQESLNDELPALQAEVDFLKITQLSQGEIISEARDLYSRWLDLLHEEKRRIVEAITENIVMGDGEVEINRYYAPPPTVARTDTGGGGFGSDDEEDNAPASSSLNSGKKGDATTTLHAIDRAAANVRLGKRQSAGIYKAVSHRSPVLTTARAT